MKSKYSRMALADMDATLSRYQQLAALRRPSGGWIKAVRSAIGMTGPQLARRMGVSQPTVSALEQREASYTITLQALMRAAEALDCTVVYAVLPNDSLKKMVETQSRHRAQALVESVTHTMLLEDQRPSEAARKRLTRQTARELVEELSSNLWHE